jgi:hypothetical protein
MIGTSGPQDLYCFVRLVATLRADIIIETSIMIKCRGQTWQVPQDSVAAAGLRAHSATEPAASRGTTELMIERASGIWEEIKDAIKAQIRLRVMISSRMNAMN